MSVANPTYVGKIQNGKVVVPDSAKFTEGGEVIIIPCPISLKAAQRKASGWLVDQVGNLLKAKNGVLIQLESDWAWRFEVYMTSLTHEPVGPIGHIDLSATTGFVNNPQATQEKLLELGKSAFSTV